MTCYQCGRSSAAFTDFCTNCGQPQPAQVVFTAAIGGAQPVSHSSKENTDLRERVPAKMSPNATSYASFLKRFVAFFIDQFIAGALAALAYLLLAIMAAASGASTIYGHAGRFRTGASLGGGILLLILGAFLAVAVYFCYYVKQETGSRQATFGKSLLGLKITTTSGSPISVGQSLGRLFIKDTLSGLIFAVGFLMAAFTERKQALHDFIAETIVVES